MHSGTVLTVTQLATWPSEWNQLCVAKWCGGTTIYCRQPWKQKMMRISSLQRENTIT